jgi:hypothetical protein
MDSVEHNRCSTTQLLSQVIWEYSYKIIVFFIILLGRIFANGSLYTGNMQAYSPV